MAAQGFFTTIAGMSLSLAGFASLIAWLRDDQTRWDVITLWRVKTIVRHALTLLAISLGLIPVHALAGDEATTIRIGAAALFAFTAAEAARHRRRAPSVWPSATVWRINMGSSAVYLAFYAVTMAIASIGMLQLGLLLALMEPAGIFYNFVSELGTTAPHTGSVVESETD